MSRSDPFNNTRCSVCGTHHASSACPGSVGARVGMVLEGKYELVRLIGHGGMGEVYEGRHRVIGRRVAVKFLHGEYARDPDVAARFENEARVAGGSEHENIAAVYDVGAIPDGARYLVMEFLDGEDVDKLVRREAPLPVARSAFIVIQACRALDVVHKRGIVHRDLKPANLFLAKRGDKTDLVKVLDFGIAKLRSADGRGGTKTGTAIGTAHYMSPEQARGERDVDARSDVYSLGVILYELLSGKKPHDGDSLLQILHKVMTQPAIPLETMRPGLPDALNAVVRRAMAPVVAARFSTVAELGDALLPFAGRALPPIRSRPAVLAPPGPDVGETRPSESSSFEAPLATVAASVVGVVRSEPKAKEARHPEPPHRTGRSRARVAASVLGAVAAAAVLAIVAVFMLLHAGPKPISPAVAASAGLVAPAAPFASGSAAPAAAALSVSTLVPILDASAASLPSGAAPLPVRTSGHQAPSSEHHVATGSAIATTQTMPPAPSSPAPVAPAPAAVPPKPTATDRGDNPF